MPGMQVSPSASLLQALSSIGAAKRPTPVAQAAPAPAKVEAAPRVEAPGNPPGGPRPGRLGQVIDIRV